MGNKPQGPLFQMIFRVLSEDCKLSSTDRIVALAIARRMNVKGRCWPSLSTIADDAGVGRATAARSVKRLCDGPAPIFAKEKRGRGNLYILISNVPKFIEARDRVRDQYQTETVRQGSKAAQHQSETRRQGAGKNSRPVSNRDPLVSNRDLNQIHSETGRRSGNTYHEDSVSGRSRTLESHPQDTDRDGTKPNSLAEEPEDPQCRRARLIGLKARRWPCPDWATEQERQDFEDDHVSANEKIGNNVRPQLNVTFQ